MHLIPDGPRELVTYEVRTIDGRGFRNTELLTLRNRKIAEVEVYFGWAIPHEAPAGAFMIENEPGPE